MKSDFIFSNNESTKFYILATMLLLVEVYLIAYSPIFGFCYNIVLFLFLSFLFSNRFLRLSLVLITVFQLILIYASRQYNDELSSDLSIYYSSFELLKVQPFEVLKQFGGGLEIGWPILYWSISTFYDLTGIQLAVLNTFLSLILIIFWIEKKIIPLVSIGEKGVIYAFFFLFINVVMLGFLQRQALTIGFLLFALTEKNNKKFLMWSLLASIFHLSSILVALIIFFIRRMDKLNYKKVFIFVVILIFFRILLIPVVDVVVNSLSIGALSHKLSGYQEAVFSISSLRFFLLNILLIFIIFIYKNKMSYELKNLYFFSITSALSIICFVGVPLFADRIFMMSFIIFGIYLYFFFFVSYKRLGLIFLLLYLLIFFLEKMNIIGSLAFGDFFWARYNYLGDTIFYYLEKI